MNKKKRYAIYVTSVLFLLAGFFCMAIAGSDAFESNKNLRTIIGLSSFLFWVPPLFILSKNFISLVISEMYELEDKMLRENNFFVEIESLETQASLKEKFLKRGFTPRGDFLHKKQFSFAKDYINYYLMISEEQNILKFFDRYFDKNIDYFVSNKKFRRNNYIYVVFFHSTLSEPNIDYVKNCIINQDVIQGVARHTDTVIPIIYDTNRGKYIMRKMNHKLSLKPLQIALRNFYKVVINPTK